MTKQSWDLWVVTLLFAGIGVMGIVRIVSVVLGGDLSVTIGEPFSLLIAFGLIARSRLALGVAITVVVFVLVVSLSLLVIGPIAYFYPDSNVGAEAFIFTPADGWPFMASSLVFVAVTGWMVWVLSRRNTRELFRPSPAP